MTFSALDRSEVAMVVRTVNFSERAGLDRVARVVTRLGNGTLYPVVAALLVLTRVVPPRFLFAASLSVLVALTVHSRLKSLLRRARPCDYNPSLRRDVLPLDRYSCPSGHTMTAVAFAISVADAAPVTLPLAALMCLLMGWSRVALGHHYVSDVLMGAVLGALVAAPIAAL